MAQRNACTALAKATRKPSPVVLNSRPPCVARERLDEVGAQRAHARQRGRLVRSDHRRIADDIGCQDAGQTAVRFVHTQNSVAATYDRGLHSTTDADLVRRPDLTKRGLHHRVLAFAVVAAPIGLAGRPSSW